MAILSFAQISQSFGALDIFSGLSASIPNDGKIGLVGPNGVGKTTLLLILAGQTAPASGQIHQAKGARLGYLSQEAAATFTDQTHSVWAEMLTVFRELRQQEAYLRQMEQQLADRQRQAAAAAEALLEQYSLAQAQFELAGGYDYELRIRQVLQGLGFDQDKWDLSLAHLSGGQKTRLRLARLLLENPDLLILDEPTNHLDVAAIEWLEGTLNSWNGALLIVSHDRYFLDRVVNTIWEMSRVGLESYRGNYTAYVQQRQERWERRQQEFAALKERLEKEVDFIKRNIAGQRTQMAKGKLSRISRELLALEQGGWQAVRGKSWAQVSNELNISRHMLSVEEAENRVKSLRPPTNGRPDIKLNLEPRQRSGHIVLRTRNLEIGYPDAPLFTTADIELHRLECAALIGPNGSGKTTFLRTVRQQLEPLAGEIKLGASLDVGYFAQAHEGLNLENTVLDELLRYRNMAISEARNYLAQYLFRGDDVYKLIRSLSGGERGRLALALLALEGANFLLLDEPTNHLDIPSQEMLQAVLEQFAGTILMVTHDRYLVDKLATQIWELREGQLHIFEGTYQELLAQRAAAATEVRAEKRALVETEALPVRSNGQLSKNEQRRLQEAITQLETEIHQMETKLDTVSTALQTASEAQAFDKIQNLSIEYETTQKALDNLIAKWEKLASE